MNFVCSDGKRETPDRKRVVYSQAGRQAGMKARNTVYKGLVRRQEAAVSALLYTNTVVVRAKE